MRPPVDGEFERYAAFFASRLTWFWVGLVAGAVCGYCFARGW